MHFDMIMTCFIFIHSSLCMKLASHFSTGDRFFRPIKYIVALLNSVLLPHFLLYMQISSALIYIIIISLLLLEEYILFKGRYIGNFALAIGTALHALVCATVALCVYSLHIDIPMYEILNNTELLRTYINITFLTHIVILILFIRFVPVKAVHRIIENNLLAYALTFIMFILVAYLIYNSNMLSLVTDLHAFVIDKLILSLFLLLIFYIMFIFYIKLVLNSKYDKIIADLEHKINKTEQISNAFTSSACMVVECNSSDGTVDNVMIQSKKIEIPPALDYTKFLTEYMKGVLYHEEADLLDKISPKNICDLYKKGMNELSFEYLARKISLDSENNIKIDTEKFLWHRVVIHSNYNSETNDVISLYVIDEINDEKLEELDLIRKSERDALTGAYNKATFENKVSHRIFSTQSGTLFIFDLDNFKSVNDKLGHSYGDKVICDSYELLSTQFRDNDLIGRFGGDEFIAYVSFTFSYEEICRICDKICKALNRTFVTDAGEKITITSSIGVARCPQNGMIYSDLFNSADTALYSAKHNGKNSYVIAEDTIK